MPQYEEADDSDDEDSKDSEEEMTPNFDNDIMLDVGSFCAMLQGTGWRQRTLSAQA